MLQNAFRASSVTIFRGSVPGRRFGTIAHRLYQSVLRALQKALAHPQQSRSAEVFVSVILMTVLEVSISRVFWIIRSWV